MDQLRLILSRLKLSVESRGQTTIDYAIGASIFMFVVGGVLLFIPTIFEPLSTSTTTNALVADQTATHITKQLLNSGETTATLDAVCTAAFFGQNTTLDDKCEFDTSSSTREMVGVSDSTDISITITNSQPVGDSSPITQEFEGNEYKLARATDTDQQNTAIATRIVSLNGDQYRLTVEVW